MEKEKKIGFFKRLKISIFNLEEYKVFIDEKFSKAFKYLLTLVAIITIILSILNVYQAKNKISKLISYVKNDFPNFAYSEGKLNVTEKVKAYDEEYDATLIADTSDNLPEETIAEYRKEARNCANSVVLLNDKVYAIIDGMEYETNYTNLLSSTKLTNFNKQEIFEKYITDDMIPQAMILIWIYIFVVLFIENTVTLLLDAFIVALFGWVASKICKIVLSLSKSINLAVYSLTLSIILSAVYSVISNLTDFRIKYFNLMYMLVAYIYIIAAIMMLKVDLNKTAGEAIPIEIEPPKKKNEDLPEEEEKEEDKKEKDTEDKKDKKKKKKEGKEETNIDTEPKGSEI